MLRRIALAMALPGSIPVFAQALNIDGAGNLRKPPDASYAAGSNQPGYWNPADIAADLDDIGRHPTAARLQTNGTTGEQPIFGATGNDERLMETFFSLGPLNHLSLTSLTTGPYDLYVYSWRRTDFGGFTSHINVFNGQSYLGDQVTQTAHWPGRQVEGETFVRIPVEVLPGQELLRITISNSLYGSGYINGIQLVPIPAPSTTGLLLVITFVRRRR